jgi:hypothetical protein
MYRSFFDNNRSVFEFNKPNTFQVCRFINRLSFKRINWSDFSYAHIIAHGNPDSIGFEEQQDHWKIDWERNEEIVKLLKTANTKPFAFNLIFYASCHSASSSRFLSSMTFETIKSQLSRYAIGFNGAIGSKFCLPEFSRVFYNHFYIRWEVDEAFRQAVSTLIDKKDDYWYAPMLYKAEGEY